jgi:hypothetical protein
LRWSRLGGIDRAGVTSTARGGATCRVGSGEGTGSLRRTGEWLARTLAWVLRAGVVARERVTDFEVRGAAGFFLRGVRVEALRFLRAERLADRLDVWRFAEREGFGLRDEDFTDNSPGMTAMVR